MVQQGFPGRLLFDPDPGLVFRERGSQDRGEPPGAHQRTEGSARQHLLKDRGRVRFEGDVGEPRLQTGEVGDDLLGVVLQQDADTLLLGSAPGALLQGGRACLDAGDQLTVGQVAALIDEDGPVRGPARLPREGGVDALRCRASLGAGLTDPLVPGESCAGEVRRHGGQRRLPGGEYAGSTVDPLSWGYDQEVGVCGLHHVAVT